MILSGITPVNLSNHIVGSMDDSAVLDGLSPTWVGCVVDPNVWGWDPPTCSGLCDGRGFTITVDPPEVLLPRCGGGNLRFGDRSPWSEVGALPSTGVFSVVVSIDMLETDEKGLCPI
jgi:hypothetical protein